MRAVRTSGEYARTAPDRGLRKLAWALMLFLALLATSASLVLFQLTSPGTAKQTLRRSVAALTEVDVLVDRNYADLQQRAAVASPGDTLKVRGFPVEVPFTPAEAKTASKADLRSMLLDRSANEIYAHGTAPLRSSAGGAGGIGAFSITGLVDHGLGFLRSRNHAILRVLTYALAVVSLLLAAGLARSCRGFGRIGSVGTVMIVAAIPVLALGLAARLYMSLNDGRDAEYTKRSFAAIARDLSLIPIRDGAALAVAGLVMVALALALGAWSDARASSASAVVGSEIQP